MTVVVNKLRLGNKTTEKYEINNNKMCRAFKNNVLVFDDDACPIDVGCGVVSNKGVREGRLTTKDLTLSGSRASIGDLTTSPDGTYILATGTGARVYRVTVSSGAETEFDFSSEIAGLPFSAIYRSGSLYYARQEIFGTFRAFNISGARQSSSDYSSSANIENAYNHSANGVLYTTVGSVLGGGGQNVTLSGSISGVCGLDDNTLLVTKENSRDVQEVSIGNNNTLTASTIHSNFLATVNGNPHGIVRIKKLLYVGDRTDKKIYAYCAYNLLNPTT